MVKLNEDKLTNTVKTKNIYTMYNNIGSTGTLCSNKTERNKSLISPEQYPQRPLVVKKETYIHHARIKICKIFEKKKSLLRTTFIQIFNKNILKHNTCICGQQYGSEGKILMPLHFLQEVPVLPQNSHSKIYPIA